MVNQIKKNLKNSKWQLTFSFGIIFILGFGLGMLVSTTLALSQNTLVSSSGYSIRLTDPNNKLISALLIADSNTPGNKKIEDLLKLGTFDFLNINDVQTISIYYRDLKSGIWAGVGEDTEYDPGSLLKVPIMIAWFKKAQDDPQILSQKLLFTSSISDGGGKEFSSLVVGNWYSVDYLIQSMISKSDNYAKDLLLSNLEPNLINSVFSDLGIQTWGDTNGQSKHISANIYSRFLDILYNSTYLSHDYSERTLDLLSTTNFNNGLRAGVPSSITVAHKFGQYQNQTVPNSPIELHDCGIIYHKINPYLLCVMTRGTANIDITTLQSIIQNVSKNVYRMVNQNEIGLPKN